MGGDDLPAAVMRGTLNNKFILLFGEMQLGIVF